MSRQVRFIRRALARGGRVRDLARAYGVHKSMISRIKHGVRRNGPGLSIKTVPQLFDLQTEMITPQADYSLRQQQDILMRGD